ncbi:hypothetical protein BROUX41_001146 [Berkeleyomyces rouxiae]|uniref:uncharacterized protein n=1 Tax=Berkeleyomyces rouxiae TaxID=2035830 RepID=UPI003B825138
MPTTLIIGGSGKVARHLTRLLSNPPPGAASTQVHPPVAHTVYSIIRDASQSDALTALGAIPLVQSIESASVADLAATMRRVQPDFVVWAAGAGAGAPPERTLAVDRDGAIKVMDALAAAADAEAADAAGAPTGGLAARRLLLVSAVDVRDRATRPVPTWYTPADTALSERMWGVIGHYMQAKLAADRELRAGNARRRLAYTIVRPGGLGEGAGAGRVRAGHVGVVGMIPREDVASAVVACMNEPRTVGLAIDFIGDGAGGADIVQAVERVASEREDSFEGYY